MDFTPRLSLPYIAAQQAQKQITYNEAMKALDTLVQPAVRSRTISVPPGSPDDGDAYIVAAAATGGWTGKDDRIAVWLDGAWTFYDGVTGWLSYVEDSAEIVIFASGAWTPFVSDGGTTVPKFGINATADLTNRLLVAADASLFTHDGADHRMKLNKSAASSTTSLVFQDAFSGRAEFGLTGDDDFHVKVSPDGSAWTEALTVARATGVVTLPIGQLAFPATQNPSSNANTLDDYEEGTWTPGVTFGGAGTGATYATANHGRYAKIGRTVIANCRLELTSKGSASGVAALTGLPFAAANVASGFWGAAAGFAANMSGVTGTVQVLVNPNTATGLVHHSNNGASAQLSDTSFSNTTVLHVTLVYEAAA